MKKIIQWKYSIINFIFPMASKRRMIIQYIYRILTNSENRKDLKTRVKKFGLLKGFKSSFYKLVVQGSKEYEEEKYKNFIENNSLSEEQIEIQKNTKFDYMPLISIITPLYNTKKEFFIDYIESIKEQTYSNFEVCLVDASSKPLDYIEKIIEKDKRIKYKKIENNGISANSNEAIKMSQGEYIALIDHDDVIEKNALYEVVNRLNENKNIDFIYTDEDKFENNINERYSPFFKPDFSPDFLRSNNYICHLSIIRKKLIEKVGLFRSEYDGAQDYDLFLRVSEQTSEIVHIPKVLYHWRVHNLSTSKNMEQKSYAIEAGKKAIEEHCRRINLNIKSVEEEKPLGLYRVKYDLKEKPLISIIIPNKDSLKYLKRAINSIKKSTYDNYEIIIVENNSKSKKIFKYYNKVEKENKIKVIYYKETGFNFSKINNYAIKHAKGEYIVLLNNDVKIINENWLEEMLGLCQRKEVGIVGAKLLYKDNTIQHVGVVLGMGGIAGHVNKNINAKASGYFGRAKVINNYSAVTAACLMTKKELYKQVNGLNEELAVAFNDIDFCLKIRELNKLVIYTPYTKLYHYESKSRGYEDTPEKQKRFNSEINTFYNKWKEVLEKGDPYYNINLSLDSEQCEIKI